MRRLIIELSIDEINRIRKEKWHFPKLKKLELIYLLRQSKNEIAGIFRVEFRPELTITDNNQIKNPYIEFQILEKEKGGNYIVFVKSKLQKDLPEVKEGYLLVPFEILSDKLRVAYFGNPRGIRQFLAIIKKLKVQFKIISLTDARFSSDTPLSTLTEKQKQVLSVAYKFGYYDLPRKITSEELSKKLNIHSSALVAHRRKAERRLLEQIFRE